MDGIQVVYERKYIDHLSHNMLPNMTLVLGRDCCGVYSKYYGVGHVCSPCVSRISTRIIVTASLCYFTHSNTMYNNKNKNNYYYFQFFAKVGNFF